LATLKRRLPYLLVNAVFLIWTLLIFNNNMYDPGGRTLSLGLGERALSILRLLPRHLEGEIDGWARQLALLGLWVLIVSGVPIWWGGLNPETRLPYDRLLCLSRLARCFSWQNIWGWCAR